MLRQALAHELGHQLDSKGPSFQTRATFSAFSHKSPRMSFSPGQTLESDWVMEGDLIEEAWEVYESGPQLLRQYFSYPFAGIGQYDHSTIKSEVFAQMHALYFTDRAVMRSEAPKWYDLMEQIYASNETQTQPDTLAAARERLRQALSYEGAEQRPEGGRVRGKDQGRYGVGLAGQGVGVGAGANQGGPAGGAQPPAANRRGPAPGGINWNVEQPGVFDAFVREWQDDKIDLKRVEQAIERANGIIQEAGRPYLTEELSRGRISARVRDDERKLVKPMLQALRESGLTPSEFNKYLWARHAPERNAQMLKVNPTLPDGSGMSNATARQTISSLRQSAKDVAALDRAVYLVDAITKDTRRILVDEDLEDQETIDNWERAYKHYVPLFRDVDEPAAGRGFKVMGPESKRAMGSKREAVAILAAVVSQHEVARIRAEKARVGRDLVKLAEEFPNADFWRVDQPPTKRTINPTTGLVQVGIDPFFRQREDVFVVKDRDPATGKVRERVLAFNPSNERALRLSRAMQSLDALQMGAITKVAGSVSRYFAQLATQWNPLFWTTNFIRDVQTAGVNLQSTKLKGQAPKVLSRIPSALYGIWNAEFGDDSSTWAKHYREYQMAGGQTGWRALFDDLVDRQRQIEKMIDRSSGKLLVAPSAFGHWAAEQVSNMNTVVENSTRLAAYVVAREQGITEREAASLAKNLTVNFDRRGNRSAVASAWYMFFKPSVQGTARMVQAIATSPRAKAMVGALIAFGAVQELLNRLIGAGDEDEAGNNPYELIPEHVRQRNWIVLLPGKDEKGNARKLTMPMAYGFNIFPNFGRLAMEVVLSQTRSPLVTEKRDVLDISWSMVQVLVDAFVPLGQSTTPIQQAAPTIADPAVQVLENKTWYGAPLVPKRTQGNAAIPSSELYFASNSETAKELARWLNSATGGDPLTPGKLDIHPGHIDHIFKTLTGGAGTFGLGMFEFGQNVAQRALGKDVEPLPAKRIPFVGKFYGEIDERDIESKFFRIKEKADPVFARYKALKKAGEHDAAGALEEREPALIDFAREAANRTLVKDLKGTRQEMKETRELPIMDRRAAKDEIKREQAQLYQRALEAYNRAAQEQRRGE
jgi:hypothetical protein